MEVSVIIPVYNNALYLDECIQSIINQKTNYSYEIIAIDDGSTDNSLHVLKKYKNKIIIIEKKNTGPGDTRNKGIKKARGKYLMFIDSDDYVADNFVEVMVNTIKKNQADVAICDFYRVNNNNIQYLNKGKAGIYVKGKINDVLLMDFHSCNKIFKKELFEKNEYPKDMFFEDVVLISKLLLQAKRIVKIDDPLYYYRNNELGTTNVINYTNYDLYKALLMIESDFIHSGYKQEIEFMYINSILVDLLIKIVKSPAKNKKEKFYELKNKVIEKYPNWYKNKYIKSCKITKRVYLFCLKKDYYKLIQLVFSK